MSDSTAIRCPGCHDLLPKAESAITGMPSEPKENALGLCTTCGEVFIVHLDKPTVRAKGSDLRKVKPEILKQLFIERAEILRRYNRLVSLN